jgi:predicted xylose isomerase-like sugar epimerase
MGGEEWNGMERGDKKRKRDANKMRNTKHEITITFSWEDVKTQAEEQGITITDKQAKAQFSEIAWGLRESLIEAGNEAIADNLDVLEVA